MAVGAVFLAVAVAVIDSLLSVLFTDSYGVDGPREPIFQELLASPKARLAFGAVTVLVIYAAVSLMTGFDRDAMGFPGVPRALAGVIADMGLSPIALIAALTVFYIVVGMFLDGISAVVLTMAIIKPMVRAAGNDLLWCGIFIVVVVEMAQITPPVGFNLFVLQGMTRHDMGYITRTALPMFLIMLLMVIILVVFPGLVSWLPDMVQANQ